MIRTLDDRDEIKKQHKEIIEKRNKATNKENESDQILRHFEVKKKMFDDYKQNDIIYTEKDNKLKEKAKLLNNEVVFELEENEQKYLKMIRPDPFYFTDRDKLKFSRKYGNKNYKEFDSKKKIDEPQKITENEIIAINNKMYYEYKRDQYNNHQVFLQEEYKKSAEEKAEVDRVL